MAWVTVGNAIQHVMARTGDKWPIIRVYIRRHYAEPAPWQVRISIDGSEGQRVFGCHDVINWVNEAQLVLAVLTQQDIHDTQRPTVIRIPVPMDKERALTVQAQIRLIILSQL